MKKLNKIGLTTLLLSILGLGFVSNVVATDTITFKNSTSSVIVLNSFDFPDKTCWWHWDNINDRTYNIGVGEEQKINPDNRNSWGMVGGCFNIKKTFSFEAHGAYIPDHRVITFGLYPEDHWKIKVSTDNTNGINARCNGGDCLNKNIRLADNSNSDNTIEFINDKLNYAIAFSNNALQRLNITGSDDDSVDANKSKKIFADNTKSDESMSYNLSSGDTGVRDTVKLGTSSTGDPYLTLPENNKYITGNLSGCNDSNWRNVAIDYKQPTIENMIGGTDSNKSIQSRCDLNNAQINDDLRKYHMIGYAKDGISHPLSCSTSYGSRMNISNANFDYYTKCANFSGLNVDELGHLQCNVAR